MATKLTLRMDERLITAAKVYARKHKTSLSHMIAAYFRSLKSGEKGLQAVSPLIEEISGILSSSTNIRKLAKDYQHYLHRKYQ